eukprot:g74035.t1
MLLNEAKVHQQLPFRHSHQYPDTFSTNNRQYGVLPYNGNASLSGGATKTNLVSPAVPNHPPPEPDTPPHPLHILEQDQPSLLAFDVLDQTPYTTRPRRGGSSGHQNLCVLGIFLRYLSLSVGHDLPTCSCPAITLLSKAASKSSHSSDGLGGLHELHLQCDTDRFTMIL